MSWKWRIWGLGMTLVFTSMLGMPPCMHSQDASQEKRKARSKVMPEYPQLARQMNVTGKVKLEAVIAADGRVTSTRIIGGSPLLVNAATDALKKWKFEPGPKETTETLEFEFKDASSN
jgi:TonB family protein